MKRTVCVAIVGLLVLGDATAKEPPAPPRKIRVGQIFIVGDTVTHPDTIFRCIPFQSGQLIDLTQLQDAERNMVALNLFKKLTVLDLDPNGREEFHDILIKVAERRIPNKFGFGACCFRSVCGALEAAGFVHILGAAQVLVDELWGHDAVLATSLLIMEKLFEFVGPGVRRSYPGSP